MSNESDIVILGHIAKDIIEIDGRCHPSLGGAVYYGGIAGAHMGLKITVITRLKNEDFLHLSILKKHGITYHAHPSKETSGLKNIYSSNNFEHRSYEPLGFAGLFEKQEIPEIITKFFVIGPIIAGEVDLDLLDYIYSQHRDTLCLDIQGFIRKIVNGRVFYQDLSEDEKEQLLKRVKILKIDQKEAEVLTNQKDINQASEVLIGYGLEEILIKIGRAHV